MQTSRTGLGRVPRRDYDYLHTRPGRLVADHLLKFSKTPLVNAFRLARLTNPVEVFKDDPLIIRLGVSHDLFADAMIGVLDKTPLATRDTLERSCCRWPGEIVLSFCSRLFCGGYSSPCGNSRQMSRLRG